MVRPPEVSQFTAGNTGTVVCVAYGDPAPTGITWVAVANMSTLSNDSRITITEEMVVVGGASFVQSILEVCSLEEGDSGSYACVADNSLGSSNATFEIVINEIRKLIFLPFLNITSDGSLPPSFQPMLV